MRNLYSQTAEGDWNSLSTRIPIWKLSQHNKTSAFRTEISAKRKTCWRLKHWWNNKRNYAWLSVICDRMSFCHQFLCCLLFSSSTILIVTIISLFKIWQFYDWLGTEAETCNGVHNLSKSLFMWFVVKVTLLLTTKLRWENTCPHWAELERRLTQSFIATTWFL